MSVTSGLLCAVGTGFIKNNSRVKEDTVMGVVFTGLFALGLVLFTKIESDQHLNHILFGSLLERRHDIFLSASRSAKRFESLRPVRFSSSPPHTT